MATRVTMLLLAVAFSIGSAVSMRANAQGGNGPQAHTACESSATRMYRACHLDTGDDFTETLAKCVHEPTAEAVAECERDAREALREDRDECREQWGARLDVCEVLGEDRYSDPLTDPAIMFVDPDDVGETYDPNPYVSVVSGRTLLVRAGEDEEFDELIVIHVSDDVREIQDVPCRVVWDIAFEVEEDDGDIEYEPVELTQDWMAQSIIGDVYYCGEAVQDFEDGIVTSIDGSFESGVDFAKAGLLIANDPIPGVTHRQEMSIGEAEDLVQYLDLAAVPTEDEGGQNPHFECAGVNRSCLKALDFSTLEPGSTELKYYLADTGFLLAVAIEDGEITGEREELVCAGDSLEYLADDACGLEADEVDALLETLCELVPDALCLEED